MRSTVWFGAEQKYSHVVRTEKNEREKSVRKNASMYVALSCHNMLNICPRAYLARKLKMNIAKHIIDPNATNETQFHLIRFARIYIDVVFTLKFMHHHESMISINVSIPVDEQSASPWFSHYQHIM